MSGLGGAFGPRIPLGGGPTGALVKKTPKPLGVKCDACGDFFVPTPAERSLDDGTVEYYLTCPECGEEYPTSRITPKGVALQRQLGYLNRQGKGHTAGYQKMLEKYRAEVTDLRPPKPEPTEAEDSPDGPSADSGGPTANEEEAS